MSKRLCAAGGLLLSLALVSGAARAQDYPSGPLRIVVPVGRGELRLKAMAGNRDYAAAVLNLPFTIQAEQLGMKSLGNTVDILGPYQANGAYALRAWVGSHGALLERYIAAYVESLRWVRRLENRAACVAILMDKLKIDRDVAERTYRLLVDPVRGFTPDAAFDTARQIDRRW